ncbi:hypothetical protein WICPIJ_007606 [Wickerhamomyces pijperi]|uniref:Uncharacterized protein n=1 Tax=Wickerhamomyces pijperi TaxID=599730 RepID=A0A9P8Q290_WICPI|nr:hypothetical protein WICPIJ_007606 [Wickerhamomyces pijperi]
MKDKGIVLSGCEIPIPPTKTKASRDSLNTVTKGKKNKEYLWRNNLDLSLSPAPLDMLPWFNKMVPNLTRNFSRSLEIRRKNSPMAEIIKEATKERIPS